MRTILVLGMVLAAVTTAGIGGAATASASNCNGTTIRSLRKCFNTRLQAQHKQIVTLQTRVKALRSSTTVAGLSSRITDLSAAVQQINNQIGCYGTLNLAQYPASTATSSGNVLGTWIDLERPDNPANNAVYQVIRNFC